MKIAVVTTCNAVGWEQYGRHMASTFVRFWPRGVQLLVYAEGFTLDAGTDVVPCTLPAWYQDFKRKNTHPDARGMATGYYNLFRDCIKFGHKVAAWTHAAEHVDVDRIIVADADIVTHSTITVEWLEKLLPNDAYIGWLDRIGTYPECGFFILNARHPAHMTVIGEVRDYYQSGKVFELRQTHDCMVMQKVIGRLARQQVLKTHSLSGAYRSTMHPLINGPLGQCLDHLKGARKTTGKSYQHDLAHSRTEDYWRWY